MNHLDLFDAIAPVYALFYAYQRKGYRTNLKSLADKTGLLSGTALDVGCGTGALASELSSYLRVTGLDGSPKMIAQARKRNPEIDWICHDLSKGIPFDDHSVDLVFSSFVLHGLNETQRMVLLKEMKRVSRKAVIILDYHEGRHPLISFVEWIEHGDYFRFMDHFKDEIPLVFDQVSVLKTNANTAFYILS